MTPPHHLLTVWNPGYAVDALDLHLRVLLGWAERRDSGEVEPDDVYVWWGKIRSPNRKGVLPHMADITALEEQIGNGAETNLYLTDYQSLYVADVDEITTDKVPDATPGELAHMPDYYKGQFGELWFRLLDLRRIVLEDNHAVIEELRRLRNTRYHDRPVSMYGGMVELPLIVTRDDGKLWFTGTEALTEGKLWAERQAGLRGETDRLSRDLRDNLFGREIWAVLEPTTREFLATAEAVFRARREDPGFDFSGPCVEYAKALETELNALLFPPVAAVLKGRPPQEREIRVESRLVDLGGAIPHQTLGALKNLLEHDSVLRGALPHAFPHDHRWLSDQLVRALKPVLEVRNPAAHREPIPEARARRLREELLGIGREGLIVQTARVKLRTNG